MVAAYRPRSLQILVILIVMQSLGLFSYGLYLLTLHGWLIRDPGLPLGRFLPFVLPEDFSFGLVMVLLALLLFLLAVSLRRMKRWAWIAVVFMQGFSLLSALLEYFRNKPNFTGMLLSIVIVFYLNQSEVQEIFRGVLQEQNG